MEMNMSAYMRTQPAVHLQRRGIERLQRIKRGTRLVCDAGILWVTQAGDRRDYVLLPGDDLSLKARGKVLVEAMRDADFHLA
jgi:hypothetical protein